MVSKLSSNLQEKIGEKSNSNHLIKAQFIRKNKNEKHQYTNKTENEGYYKSLTKPKIYDSDLLIAYETIYKKSK
jgi:hypothetical protein